MFSNASTYDKYRVLPEGTLTPATPRYRFANATPASIDALLGLDAPPPPIASWVSAPPTPQDWLTFDAFDAVAVSPLDAWAEAFGIAPPPQAKAATPPPPDAPIPPADAATSHRPPTVPPEPAPATTWPATRLGPCPYPSVGGGFDCTRDGMRIILPPIRWPLLPPLDPCPAKPSAPARASALQPAYAPKPMALAARPTSPRAHAVPTAVAPPAHRAVAPPAQGAVAPPAHTASQPPPVLAAPTAAPGTTAKPQPAWRCAHYGVPPFTKAPGESLRRTHEFPVLQSPNAGRQVWHYCSVMARPGVFAGHFEVHALSQADIAGDGRQRRIIVYSRGAHTGAGRYQLAMDTHPEGPAAQPRIFLLHDAQANHYQFLATRDTSRPKELLTSSEARPQESGGAGDCLFFSVARGLGYGAYHQQAATHLRRMATSFLYHHPDASLNGDTLALFVNKL